MEIGSLMADYRPHLVMQRSVHITFYLLLAAVSISLGSCSLAPSKGVTPRSTKPPSSRQQTPTNTVILHFDDWAITRQDSNGWMTAGDIVFRLINDSDRRHEFVIVWLPEHISHPEVYQGRLDEEQFPQNRRISELEDLPAHTESTQRLHLPAGDYLIFCNIVEQQEGLIINHYMQGMHTRLEVRPASIDKTGPANPGE